MTTLDGTPVPIDNVVEPLSEQRGRIFKINKSDLPEGKTHCKSHDLQKDTTETHKNMQGYICSNCQFGVLRRI